MNRSVDISPVTNSLGMVCIEFWNGARLVETIKANSITPELAARIVAFTLGS